jgi:ABC-type sulfate/molybdate transport systems ATPase subunit
VTHDISEAASATDRVIMIKQGRVDRIGSWESARSKEPPK